MFSRLSANVYLPFERVAGFCLTSSETVYPFAFAQPSKGVRFCGFESLDELQTAFKSVLCSELS